MSKKIEFHPLSIAILTISDTRTDANDASGTILVENLTKAGHNLASKEIVVDDTYQIRAIVSRLIADKTVHVIITTGGTGVTGRDTTPEAIMPLFDKSLDGFGELFRMLSYSEIGTSSLQSRAIAGVANGMYIFCLPGSPGACETAWDKIIKAQLDSRTLPCNLSILVTRLQESHQ